MFLDCVTRMEKSQPGNVKDSIYCDKNEFLVHLKRREKIFKKVK